MGLGLLGSANGTQGAGRGVQGAVLRTGGAVGGRNSQLGLGEFVARGWCNNPVPFQVEELNKKLTQHEKATRSQQQRVKVCPWGPEALLSRSCPR